MQYYAIFNQNKERFIYFGTNITNPYFFTKKNLYHYEMCHNTISKENDKSYTQHCVIVVPLKDITTSSVVLGEAQRALIWFQLLRI